ncbi:MAG: hypothetical protein V4505_22950 [Pseudomonadota bacterium]
MHDSPLSVVVRWLTRLVLLAAGLVVAASLLCVVLVLAAFWGLRFAWARLTGRPVVPWVMRVDPRGAWGRFSQPGARQDGAPMPRRDNPAAPRELHDVTDVEPK